MQELKDTHRLQDILNTTENLFLVLGASWCDNCTNLKNKITQFSQGKITSYFIDLDKNQDFVDEYEVKKIPVLLGFKNGILTFTSQGATVDIETIISNF